MIGGVCQARITGISAQDGTAASGLARDGSDAHQGSQGVIVSPLQGLASFCQQRDEVGPPDSRQGGEDDHVTLHVLSRLGFPSVAEFVGQGIELPDGVGDLAVDEPDAVEEGVDVSLSRLGGSRGQSEGRPAQDLEYP